MRLANRTASHRQVRTTESSARERHPVIALISLRLNAQVDAADDAQRPETARSHTHGKARSIAGHFLEAMSLQTRGSLRSFDREFRDGAVRIVRETGKPIARVARELGLNEGTLGRWVNLDRRAREGEGPLSESERDELNRLRKGNAELAMERDVLKRSTTDRFERRARSAAGRSQTAAASTRPHRRWKALGAFTFTAVPRDPITQGAGVDIEIAGNLGDRLTRLPNNPNRPLLELLLVLDVASLAWLLLIVHASTVLGAPGPQ